ncbi:MAG: 50S ribosomal protein L1 [Acidobacteriota bacterium]
MAKRGKKHAEALSKVEAKLHEVAEAVSGAKAAKWSKFVESVDMAVLLGVDPRHADQMVRGTVLLPHGTGKTKRVVVFAQGEKIAEAEAAGADAVGGADLAEKIRDGWMDFEAVVATPDMMREVGKLGKVLGPRGLMPNPKSGTVTPDVTKAIGEIKAGRVEFRVDKKGVVHAPVGRISFDEEQLVANVEAFLEALVRAKPAAAKGTYMKAIYLSSTMGPSFRIDPSVTRAAAAA